MEDAEDCHGHGEHEQAEGVHADDDSFDIRQYEYVLSFQDFYREIRQKKGCWFLIKERCAGPYHRGLKVS